MELRLDLRLSQKLVMTPQLRQAITLLQLSRMELQQMLVQQLMDNPLLEEINADADEDAGVLSGETMPGGDDQVVGDGDVDGESGGETVGAFSEPLSPDGWEDYYESDWPSGSGGSRGPAGDMPSSEQTMESPITLEGHLLWQLRLASEDEADNAIGVMLIGNLDEDGYLRASVEEIAEASGVSVKTVESVLSLIQTFDPVGVGARDLRECLLIQHRHRHAVSFGPDHADDGPCRHALVARMINDHLPDIQKKRYDRIARAVGRSMEEIGEAVHVIERLEPKPGRPYGADANHVIVPDVFVRKDEGAWLVFLNEDGLPRVRINPDYERMLGSRNGEGQAAQSYLEDKWRGARWILRSLEQRNRTLLRVVGSVVKFQEPFLEKGIRYLKPCALKQVADDVGMHESTISRVTRNKYMHCPQGLLELKFFFNAGIQRTTPGGDDVASPVVRELIRAMVAREDRRNPLNDREIASQLRESGMVIANRSVARYRTELRLAPAGQRKRIPPGSIALTGKKTTAGKERKKEKSKLGLKLEEMLREKGMNRKQLMDVVQASPSAISYLLRQRVWKQGTLDRISAWLHVPQETFLACYGERDGRQDIARIRDNLIGILDRHKMTLADLAGKAGIPMPVMHAYMNTRKMQRRTQQRIAVILGVGLETLTARREPRAMSHASRADDGPGTMNGVALDGAPRPCSRG